MIFVDCLASEFSYVKLLLDDEDLKFAPSEIKNNNLDKCTKFLSINMVGRDELFCTQMLKYQSQIRKQNIPIIHMNIGWFSGNFV